MPGPRFLFVGHDASRTGAPVVLLHLLRWIRQNHPDISFEVLLIEGGVLESEYQDVAPTTVLADSRTIAHKVYDKLHRIVDKRARNFIPAAPILKQNYDALIGNTILTLPLLNHFSKRNIRTICWMHEMEYVIRLFFHEKRFRSLANSVGHLILPSKALYRVTEKYRIHSPAIIVPELQPPRATSEPGDERSSRETLGIPTEAFVVFGCGTLEWRKGVDIFLDVASEMVQRYSDVYFIWVGGPGKDRKYVESVFRDLDRINSPRVRIDGVTKDLSIYFEAANVFALTSREDPFPLVCLMAADRSLPTVCFQDSGGIPEFVGLDAGMAVPLDDARAFEVALSELYKDRDKLESMGQRANEKFLGPYSIDAGASRILALIESGA